MKMNNFIAAMIAILIGGPFAWEFLDRSPPFEILGGVTIPSEVQRGKDFRIEWNVNPTPGKHCPGTVYRYVVDSHGKIWIVNPTPAAFGLMPMTLGKVKVMGSIHQLPKDIPSGHADIYIRASYVCNFTQYIWPLTIITDPIHTTVID